MMVGTGNAITQVGLYAGGSRRSFAGAFDPFAGQLYAAVGLRRMLTSYTGPLIRARRSSDNAQQDFGYRADGWLDTGALLSWAAGASVFVPTAYDQTGNSRHGQQLTTTQQPRIALGGVLDVGPNGFPVLTFDGGDDALVLNNSTSLGRNAFALTLASVGWANGINNTFVQVLTQSASPSTRLLIQRRTGGVASAGGRRLAAQNYVGIDGTAVPVGASHRLIGRARYSAGQADVSYNGTVTTGAFQGAGLTDDAPAVSGVCVGAATTAQYLAGAMSCTVMAQAALDIPTLDTALAQIMP